MVWNAAGSYDIDPPFLAYLADGSPDFYFNTLIGLSEKWMEWDLLEQFFRSYAHSARAADFDALIWLAMESLLYEKEVRERPMMEAMRRDYAERFFKEEQTLSRQEMMAHAPRVYEQSRIRWGAVLEKKALPMTPGAKRLRDALILPADTDTKTFVTHMQDVLAKEFRFRDFRLKEEAEGIAIGKDLGAILRNVMRRDSRQRDSLIVRHTGMDGGARDRAPFGSRRILEKTAEDEDYIRDCFGESILDAAQVTQIENELCTGDHALCRLWYAGTKQAQGEVRHKEAQLLAKEIEKQYEKNVAFYNRSSVLIAAGIRSLSAQLDAILSTYLQPLPERARAGDLDGARAYRMRLLKDPYVFTHPGDEVENNLSVDLLLDASSSRAPVQEIIAGQAYILAKSLMRCHIPVQITSFRSVRGYTVLQQMKTYREKELTGLFRYYAAGWNRDGLALRAVKKLTEGGGEKKLLLVLTDAHPVDSQQMPPEEGSVFTREYDNLAAVQDTIEAVRALREDDFMVGAIFTGINTFLENVRAIYGKYMVRVRKTEQLAQGAGALLTSMLDELRN